MKNKNRYVYPLKRKGLSSALNVSLLMCVFSFLLTACSEKEQKPKDFIEIDMVPAIEGEAKKMHQMAQLLLRILWLEITH